MKKIDSETARLIDKKRLKISYGIIIIGLLVTVIISLFEAFLNMIIIPMILIGSLMIFLGVHGAYTFKSSMKKEFKISRREKVSIGLSEFGGILNISIGLSSLFGFGLLITLGVFFRTFIGITFIPSGILAIVGAFIEYKSLIIGGVLCLLAAILSIVLPLIINYYDFYSLIVNTPYFYFFTVFIIVGAILGILEHKKMKQVQD